MRVRVALLRPALLLATLVLPAPVALRAQTIQPELRAEVIHATSSVWHLGAGLTQRLGHYARVSLVGSYGIADDTSSAGEWRGDLFARLTLDPFRRSRFGFSFGGGLTVRHRPWLLAVAELEGPEWRGITLAAQGGLGGGYRAGLVLRRAARGRR